MKTVAARDEIAVDSFLASVLTVGQMGLRGVEVRDRDALGLVHRRQSGGLARVHEVARELRLTVHQDALAPRVAFEIDAMPSAARENFEAVVDQPLSVHAGADACLPEKIDADLLEHAGPDAAEHVVARLTLEHDGFDTGFVQELPE